MHEGGGRWVGSNKLVELKKKKKKREALSLAAIVLLPSFSISLKNDGSNLCLVVCWPIFL